MNSNNTEEILLYLAYEEIHKYKMEIIKKHGLNVCVDDVRKTYPELSFMEDEEINHMIDEAIVEFVEDMINECNKAIPGDYMPVSSQAKFVKYRDMLGMIHKRVLDRKERLVLEIMNIDEDSIYFDDDTFIGEDYKHDHDRYVAID